MVTLTFFWIALIASTGYCSAKFFQEDSMRGVILVLTILGISFTVFLTQILQKMDQLLLVLK